MLLIWGWKVRFKTLLVGVFFCPACGGDRTFEHKQGRRWFTLFFLPVIPLGAVGEPFIECTTCRNAFRPDAANQPTSAALAENLVAATREAVVWLLRVATPGPATVAVALDVLSTVANRPWTEAELQADLASLDVNGLQNRLATLAAVLNEHGREALVGGCARVAAADGSITPAERQLLDNVAAALTMTPAHTRGVIAQVSEDSRH